MNMRLTKSPWFILPFLFVSTLSTGQELGFKLEGNRKKAVIPIEILNNLIIIPVILNDIIPLKFILDTGVRTTILTRKEYSDLLGLTYSKKYTVYGLGDKKSIDALVTNNVSLSMPGVRGVGHSILALKEDYLKLRNYLGDEVHGILGYELFSRFIIQIDYAHKRLIVMHPDKFKKSKRSQVLPMVVQDTKPYINATIQLESSNPFEVKLLVDTGSSHGLLLEPETHDSIILPQRNIKNIIGRGLGGPITGRVARITSLELGMYKIDNPVTHFPDTNSYANNTFSKKDMCRNGTLGGGILNRFTVTLDFALGNIYFKKNSAYKKKSYYDMSGLTIQAYGPKLDLYKIVHIMPHSPGMKARLQVEDNVLSINGNSTSQLTLNNINSILSSRINRRIWLKIERGGEQMTINLHLVDLI